MDTNTLSLSPQQQLELAIRMNTAAQSANRVVNDHVFKLYLSEKSENTQRTQLNALNAFSQFLATVTVKVSGNDLQSDPVYWQGISYGLIEAFKQWQLQQGTSIATINNRLSAIKMYVKLAAQAGFVPADESYRIQAVRGYSRKVGKRINEGRDKTRVKTIQYEHNGRTITRTGTKKSEPVILSSEQAQRLKMEHGLETAQGARDVLLMCLLLDHGLRCSEVAQLQVNNLDLKLWELTFYRPKVDKIGTHKLTADSIIALTAYLPYMPVIGGLIQGSRKGGALTGKPMSERAITGRVNTLAKRIGVDRFSAHDCRHYCATDMARKGYSLRELMDWFGWASPAMAMRYVESAVVQERDKG